MEAIIDAQALDSYVATLATKAERSAFHSNIEHLQQMHKSSAPLQDFMAAFGQRVATLYAATAVAIWFQNPNQPGTEQSSGLQCKVDIGVGNLRLDESNETAHRQLVEFALQHGKPLAVQPFSGPIPRANVSNPTDSFLLLTPVKFGPQDVALLEIALGPKPLRRPHLELTTAYLAWSSWLSQLLQNGIEQGFARADEPFVMAVNTLEKAERDAAAIQDSIRIQIEASIQQLAGENFGSLSANQTVAKQVHALLDSKGLRVRCPECGAAAILRCQNAGNSKAGVFTFDHYLDTGRTFHGGQTTFPLLSVVPKPPRRSRK